MAQAIKTPDHYRFVIAKTDEAEEEFDFIELTPAEMMEFSTIPPFKVYFNIDLNNDKGNRIHRTAIQLTAERIDKLVKVYESMRNDIQA